MAFCDVMNPVMAISNLPVMIDTLLESSVSLDNAADESEKMMSIKTDENEVHRKEKGKQDRKEVKEKSVVQKKRKQIVQRDKVEKVLDKVCKAIGKSQKSSD